MIDREDLSTIGSGAVLFLLGAVALVAAFVVIGLAIGIGIHVARWAAGP